jgi:hypothetical protein
LYLCDKFGEGSSWKGREAVAANHRGTGRTIWLIARLVAPPLAALVLAGVALPQILDSPTVRIPTFRVGVGSGSGPAPVEKIVVTAPAALAHLSHGSHRRARKQTPKPATAQNQGGGQPISSLIGGPAPAPQPPTAAQPVTTPKHAVTHHPKATHPKRVHQRHVHQKPTTPPSAPPVTGPEDDQGHESGHHGLALGHQKPAFPGKAGKDKGQPPRGLARGHRDHFPPGQARKESRPPRGVARGYREHVPPGQASKSQHSHSDEGDDSDEQGHSSPGHGNGAHGQRSHGRGRGH